MLTKAKQLQLDQIDLFKNKKVGNNDFYSVEQIIICGLKIRYFLSAYACFFSWVNL